MRMCNVYRLRRTAAALIAPRDDLSKSQRRPTPNPPTPAWSSDRISSRRWRPSWPNIDTRRDAIGHRSPPPWAVGTRRRRQRGWSRRRAVRRVRIWAVLHSRCAEDLRAARSDIGRAPPKEDLPAVRLTRASCTGRAVGQATRVGCSDDTREFRWGVGSADFSHVNRTAMSETSVDNDEHSHPSSSS